MTQTKHHCTHDEMILEDRRGRLSIFATKKPGGIVLRMTWKVYACPKRMCRPGINGEGELRGQPANPGSPGEMAVKTECVCVCVCVCVCYTHSNCLVHSYQIWHSNSIHHQDGNFCKYVKMWDHIGMHQSISTWVLAVHCPVNALGCQLAYIPP